MKPKQTAAAIAVLANSVNWDGEEFNPQDVVDAYNAEPDEFGSAVTAWLRQGRWKIILELACMVDLPLAFPYFVAKHNFVVNRALDAKVRIAKICPFFKQKLMHRCEDKPPGVSKLFGYRLCRASCLGSITKALDADEKNYCTFLKDVSYLLEQQGQGQDGVLMTSAKSCNVFYVLDDEEYPILIRLTWSSSKGGWVISAEYCGSNCLFITPERMDVRIFTPILKLAA